MCPCSQLTGRQPFPRTIPTRIEELAQMLVRGRRSTDDRADRISVRDSFAEISILSPRRIAQIHRVEQLDHLRRHATRSLSIPDRESYLQIRRAGTEPQRRRRVDERRNSAASG